MRAAAIYLLTRNEEVTTNYALKLQDFPRGEGSQGDVASRFHRRLAGGHLATAEKRHPTASSADPGASGKALKASLCRRNWEYGSLLLQQQADPNEATAFTILCRHFP